MGGFQFLSVLFVFSFLMATPKADGWEGVWRLIFPDSEQNPRVHLVIGADVETRGATYYDEGWSPRLLQPSEVSADRLVLAFHGPGRAFRIDVSRKAEGRLVGKFEIRHVQYRAEIDLVGARVVESRDWDPLRVTGEGGDLHLIDLNQLLLSQAADLSEEAFERFWDEEIAPGYYHLFEDFLYPEKSADHSAESLREIRRMVRDPAYQEVARRFPVLRGEVLNRIKSDFPQLLYTTPYVAMPALGNFALSPFRIENSLLLRVGIDRLRGVSDDALRAWLAREQFRQALYSEFGPWDETDPARIVRDGIATYLAVESGLASSPESCFLDQPVPVDVDRLDEYRAELAKALESRTPSGLDDSAVLTLGLAFAERFVADYGPSAVRSRSRAEFTQLLRDFATEPPAEDVRVR